MGSVNGASLVQSFYAAFDERPYEESVAPFLADSVVWHVAGANPLAGTFRGVAEVLAAMNSYSESSGGTLRLNTITLLGDADHVVAVHEASAELGDEREYRAHEVDVFHVRDGRITEFWSFSEDQEATDQLWAEAVHRDR